MRKINVNDYGVSVIEMQDAKEINGGWGALAWFLVGVIVGELNDRGAAQDFKDGMNASIEKKE